MHACAIEPRLCIDHSLGLGPERINPKCTLEKKLGQHLPHKKSNHAVTEEELLAREIKHYSNF